MSSPKVLEHCCYTKYLAQWWQEMEAQKRAFEAFTAASRQADVTAPAPHWRGDHWSLIHFGDHMVWEIAQWFVNMCRQADEPVKMTVAIPVLMDNTVCSLCSIRGVELTLLSREDFSAPLANPSLQRKVVVPGLHTQTITISGAGRNIVLSGGLLQAFSPGEYVIEVSIGEEYYSAIQPHLESWTRYYSRKRPSTVPDDSSSAS